MREWSMTRAVGEVGESTQCRSTGGRMVADHLEDGVGVRSRVERAQEIVLALDLGDASEGVKMLLELALGNEEQGDEMHRLTVERIEFNAGTGTCKNRGQI